METLNFSLNSGSCLVVDKTRAGQAALPYSEAVQPASWGRDYWYCYESVKLPVDCLQLFAGQTTIYILMPRWDYDTVFYRVFCITLLGITFTFTVILTNVFIDIDGLLFKKNKEHLTVNSEQGELHAQLNFITPNIEGTADDYKDYGNDKEPYDAERTKRSVEIQDALKTIKDITMKKVLSNRLAALLEDLEKSEPEKNKESQESEKKSNDDEKEKPEKSKEVINDKEKSENLKEKDAELGDVNKSRDDFESEIMEYIKKVKKQEKEQRHTMATEDEMKHLAMHNIILQGLVGHMDLNEVYNKMHVLMERLEKTEVNNVKKDMSDALYPTEEKGLFEELLNCKQLKQQIDDEFKQVTDKNNPTGTKKAKKVMIKTIIDISSLNDKTNQRDTSSKENVNGIIKLIYNGNELKFKRVDGISTTEKPKLKQRLSKLSRSFDEITTSKTPKAETYVPKMYTSKIINDYLKKMSESGGFFNETKFEKRLKRHINIQYDNDESSTKKPAHPKNKDDELFLEIETHFNSKGLKGDDKKKMIRDLISKIQKAIHTEKESMQEKPKRHKHLHVKKRTQNPLDKEGHKPMAHDKPVYFLVRRDSDPISKTIAIHDKQPVITDHRGDSWHQKYNQPRFLGEQKGINSIEMGELNADYNQGMLNTIAERVQKPLNIQTLYNPLDPRSAKFVMKDIAGSGFSIGFNQYVDDPPDAASMNLFSGIENIIKTYHQKYDEGADSANGKYNDPIPEDIPKISVNQEYIPNPYSENPDYPPNQEYLGNRGYSNRGSQENVPPESNQHTIVRRSIEQIKRDFQSDEYDVIYKTILDNKHNKKKVHSFTKNNALKFIDDNIFTKDLKPSEILSLANLLGRKKRTINVKKISNLHNHRSLNRYLNTKSMASKMIFQHNKRSKRQIDKIRIVAKDRSSAKKQKLSSAEEIFVLSSNENVFSDRAIVRQIDNPFEELNEGHKTNYDNEHYDIVSSIPSKQQSEEHYDIISAQKEPPPEYLGQQVPQGPYYVAPQPQQVLVPPQEVEENVGAAYDVPAHSSEQSSDADYFTRRSRHNPLMSKYPHIFMEEMARSKEEYRPDSLGYERVDDKIPDISQKVNTAEQIIQMPENEFAKNIMPKTSEMDGIVSIYSPQDNNYKLTVKILPKNGTGLNSGFKETHTSINKSYNKNGLIYTSLLNVSEISKVEKINNETNVATVTPYPFAKALNEEQIKMRYIIQEHKNRIDEQLAHLMAEKEKLLHLEDNTGEFLKEGSTNLLHAAPWTAPGRSNDNYHRQLELQEAATTTEKLSTTTQQTTTEPTTTQQPTTIEALPTTTTKEPPKPVTEDYFKSNVIKKISQNEQMTDEILKKIDKNTVMLQRFLEKIVYKIESGFEETITAQKPSSTQKPTKYENPEPSDFNGNLNQPLARPNDFLQKIPEIFFNQAPYAKLNSSVPFIYAFQHPYMSQNSRDKNIANVVYQGHIHTQTTHNIPDIAFRNIPQDHAFPNANEHERIYQTRGAQFSPNLQKTQNDKPLDSSYPNMQTLKSDRVYQSIDTSKKGQNYANIEPIKIDQSYPNMQTIKTDQSYKNMQSIKTDQSYKNMQSMKTDQSYKNMQSMKTDQSYKNMQTMKNDQNYPSAKIGKTDYPNKEAITTGQNYENLQTTKTKENYENAPPIKSDQSFPDNIKTKQNFDNAQLRKTSQNYDSRSIKIDENYETMTRKQWNDKNTDNKKEWKNNIRSPDLPAPVVIPNVVQNNSTKFFIDELESEFKVVIPIDGKKKF